jgi:hypothetical protein
MYEHFYVLEELQKQRATEIKRQVKALKMKNKKHTRAYFPTLKQNKTSYEH